MLAIAALVVALQLAALYTPLNDFLDLDPLGAVDLAVCLSASAWRCWSCSRSTNTSSARRAPTAVATADEPTKGVHS